MGRWKTRRGALLVALVALMIVVTACESGVPASNEILNTLPATSGYTVTHDIPYQIGANSQKLDRYVPNGTMPSGGWPVIVYVHGGGWFSGSKADIAPPAAYGGASILAQLDNGFAVLSVDYDLTAQEGHSPFVSGLLDVKNAVRWVLSQTVAYSPACGHNCLNFNKVSIAGNSAGGTLALMVAATPGVAALEPGGTGATYVRSAVSLDGPSNLRSFYHSREDTLPWEMVLKQPGTLTTQEEAEFGSDGVSFNEVVPFALGCAFQEYASTPCQATVASNIDAASPSHYVTPMGASMPHLYLACASTHGQSGLPVFPPDFGCDDLGDMATAVNIASSDSNRTWFDDTRQVPRPCTYASPTTAPPTSQACESNHFTIDRLLNLKKLNDFLNTYGK